LAHSRTLLTIREEEDNGFRKKENATRGGKKGAFDLGESFCVQENWNWSLIIGNISNDDSLYRYCVIHFFT